MTRDNGASSLEDITDAIVVGAGPSGWACALLLAREGLSVRLFAPPPPPGDTRTSALLRGSVRLMEALEVWDRLEARAAPLEAMRLVDDTGRLLRAPTLTFHSKELGGGPFGYNVVNRDLLEALAERAAHLKGLIVEDRPVTAVSASPSLAAVARPDGSRAGARLVVGADGRHSLCRQAAGITVRERHFPQTAIACNLTHSAPHHGASTEIHKPGGPMTFVPLPGRASSLVWVTAPDEARALMALDEAAFAERVREQSHALLGDILSVGPRAAFPSASIMASAMAGARIALVGEAGHVLPPIGAQGLNLGFRDAAMLAEVAGRTAASGGDIGGPDCLDAYARRRGGDIASRSVAVNLLNRSVLGGFFPLTAARGAGLHVLGQFAPLRKVVMEAGLAPPADMPLVMRPAA